ncbi:MAG: NAD-binding protein [Bacilli bacterium]|nr:NAD-binding protein [Bacilli bacterium]
MKYKLVLSMVINPESLTADSVSRALSIPSALEETTFLKGKIQMISLKVPEEGFLNGSSINSLSKKLPGIIVCAIERDNNLLIPKGSTKLQYGDKINITGSMKDIKDFLEYTDLKTEKTKNVIICGGSSIAMYLAKNLIDMGMKVKIIEINEERCKLLSEKLPKALIINGDVNLIYTVYEKRKSSYA